ncbi:hypothetical protein [Streptomyces sp900129855]|uniref:Uncharacterized protein n=1 Tax=Streptomyces sp. 900129855 TaxID=3155129 RepID=A0ABV2ZLD8_9ACTN
MITFLVAAPTPTPTPAPGSGGISAPTATLISAVIAFLTASIVGFLTNIFTIRREDKKYRRELNLQRLNELYAPLKLLLAQDLVLAKQLREGKPDGPDGWHLLDHIDEVLADEQDKVIANQILEINKKIAGILETKAGLALVPMSDSFSTFLGHHAMLSRALQGRAFVRTAKFEYFAKDFEKDVEAAYVNLSQEIKKEAGK